MLILPGYQITEAIHEGFKTIIYRGIKLPSRTSIIIKTLIAEYPTLEEISQLRHEYKIISPLNIQGIAKPIALENYKNGLALILEDFQGSSCKKLMSEQKISILAFLSIALQLAQTLHELHQNNVIHKDIKPQNILINPQNWAVKLIDFSIASRLSRETPKISNPDSLEGTLIYMSPEQTGRMNRSLDYRTDFYSLGVTFYEILTGELPFNTKDPLELVHCHIAKTPVSPHQINPEIPQAISEIVMKLMAKNAEDRYQSALGLKADIETCFNQLVLDGEIINFVPGEMDKSGQFLIPQKLYGREEEVVKLLETFNRVAVGATEMMLVSGYSGIGKTSVVNEVHKPIVRQRGYFISGKYDQFKRNIPYSAFIQAFSELMRQLLTESKEKIEVWKTKLLEALGQNGQVIIDVIPEVEWIIGKQPEVVQLGPTESQNRFNRVFQKFIGIFAQKEHPLVLFLDDLQWADSASLKLIELIMTDTASQYLLLIGAYRDNEVSPTHATIQTIEKIQQTGAVVNNIILEALSLENILTLVNDTLVETVTSPHLKQAENTELARVRPLAELIFNKTQGNPFFLTTLLSTLYSDKLLTFDFTEGRWLWDLEQIQALGITDYNVVELVARNIQKLPETTQQVLKLAACIGNTFNLDNLAVVNEQSLLTTADELWEALQAGLILPLSSDYKIPLFVDELEHKYWQDKDFRVSYKFLHDRVQQAAYSLIPELERKVTHLKIGQLLLQKTAKFALLENIFDIVNQLNIGIEFITKEAEQEELAKLNLMAGKKALAATAYDAAARYLNVGLQLLPPDGWERKYELTRDLFVETAAAEYLNINFERAKELSDVVLARAKTLLEKVPVYETQIQFYIAQNQMQAAINIALSVLKLLGVNVLSKPSKMNILLSLVYTKIILSRKPIEVLANQSLMRDPFKLAAMRLLMAIFGPAYFVNPNLVPLLTFTMIHLCIKYGNSPLVAYAYSFYGVLCVAIGDINEGYKYGQLGARLVEQFNSREIKPKVNVVFNNGIRHWKEPAKKTLQPLQESLQIGLEVGDIENACYNAMNYCFQSFLVGESLENLAQSQVKYRLMMLKLKQELQLVNTNILSQAVLNLIDESLEKGSLIGDIFNETEMLPTLKEKNNIMLIFNVYFFKSILLYLFKDTAMSLEQAFLASKYVEGAAGSMAVAVHNFYYSLALIAQHPHVSKREQKEYLSRLASNQKRMKKWASHTTANFEHKYLLVEAEKAGVLGEDAKAMEYYDLAIKGAREQGYIQEEALANELAAEFYFSRSREKIAQMYLTEAYYSYIRWGAKAKVKHLEERYPQFFSQILKREPTDIDINRTTTSTSTTGGSASALDLVTVTKASQAISSEIVLDKFLAKLMQITIENVGASKGYLLLSKSGKLVLVAEGAVEKSKVRVLPSVPVESRPDLPLSIINYVERSQQTVVLNNATVEGLFTNDPYILKTQPKSIFCWPLTHKGKFTGILYLENNLSVGAFTAARLSVLKLLAAQASISLENATLYEELQAYSQQLEAKNQELDSKNEALQKSEAQLKEKKEALEKYLQKLQQTQAQLVQTEKISSLGQLVAGVAHEVNNPVSFINGNLHHASEYVQDLLNILNLYQHHFPNAPAEIQEEIESMELEYIREDLPKMLSSMKVGTDRIREIMQSLRNFSRVDDGSAKSVNIHEGIESTLMILQHRLKAKGELKAIRVVKEYGNLPKVQCYAGQLNQVFMNILANAIDAMEEERVASEKEIKISTELINESLGMGNGEKSNYSSLTDCELSISYPQFAVIKIKDNGPGMTEEVRSKLFNPFFTTKPIGKGTGLGLSISYQIVVEKHRGTIECISAPREGTEFVIAIPIKQQNQKVAYAELA